jgi:hypothetical protein
LIGPGVVASVVVARRHLGEAARNDGPCSGFPLLRDDLGVMRLKRAQ